VSRNNHRIVVTSILAGMATLAINSVGAIWITSTIEPGNLLLFVVSLALGWFGALIASAVAVIPALLFGGELIWAARTIILCVAIALFCKSFPRIPAFLVPIALWFLIVSPTQFATSLEAGSLFEGQIILTLWEVCALALAGLIILMPQTWSYLNITARHVELRQLIPAVLTALTTFVALMLMVIMPAEARGAMVSQGLLLPVVFISCCAPGLLGWWLAKYIEDSSQRVLSHSVNNFGDQQGINAESSHKQRAYVTGDVGEKVVSSHWLREAFQPEGMISIDSAGIVNFVNPAFREAAQIHSDELIGKPLTHFAKRHKLIAELLEFIADFNKSGTEVREIKLNSSPEKLQYFRAIIEKETKAAKSTQAVLIRIEEITDKRTIEAHLIQAQKMKSLGGVVAGMAHAFNNFLTSIIGQASFATHSRDSRVQQSAFEEILKAANRASELVWCLLEFSEGKPAPQKKLELNNLIEQRLEFFRKFIGERYELTFSCAPRSIGVSCDTNLLTQVLTDVLRNAKESYGDSPGSIHISLDTEEMGADVARLYPGARPGHFARLIVKDNGMGMNRETMAKAFDPLFTTRAEQGHSGLGLSIVFSIVRAHDGFLAVESFPDKGTSISIYLPMVELDQTTLLDGDLQQTLESAEQIEDKPGAKNKSILVVEDEPTVRTLVTKMLSTLGYEVQSCSNGEDALRICDHDRFDLVIVDMMMPKMSGIDLIDRLKTEHKQNHALIMTGYGLNNAFTGSESVIAKPFDIQTLAARVREALNHQDA